jgi:hypothetical protein
MSFDFDADNDPHGEHDFGAFDLAGGPSGRSNTTIRLLKWGSEDPADPEKTTRVLTVMLAEEY